jgi:outer membrane protein TolC
MPQQVAVHSGFCLVAFLSGGLTVQVRFPILLGAVVLMLGGCSTPLAYTARPAPLAPARTQFAARRLDDPALGAFLAQAGAAQPRPGQAWSFDALALVAGWFSADVAKAQARWQAALEQRQIGVAAPVSQFDAFLEHHSTTDAVRHTPWTLGLGFELTLPDPTRRAARAAQLDAEVALARLDLARAFWDARQRVRETWIAARAAAARVPLLGRQGLLWDERVQRTEVRFAHGEVAESELQAAMDARQQLRWLLAERQRQASASQAALRNAIGLPADGAELRLAPLSERPDLDAVARSGDPVLAALDNRLDLRAAEARFRLADAGVRWEVALQYPELGIKPGYEWDQGDHRLRVGIALPFALPQAHRAEVARAVAEREVRARELLGLQEEIIQQVVLGQRALTDALARRAGQADLLTRAHGAAARAATMVRLGEVDPLKRIDADLQVLARQLEDCDADVQLALSAEQLEDAVEQPLGQLAAAIEQMPDRRLPSAPPGDASDPAAAPDPFVSRRGS